MKINLLVTLVDLHFGGISNLALHTLPNLPENINPSVVYFGPNDSMLGRFEKAGLRVTRIPYNGGKDILKAVHGLRNYIRENKIHIVSTNFTPDKLIVSLTRLTRHFLIIGTIHNTFDPNITPRNKKTFRLRGRFEEFFHNKICNRVIGVSNKAITNAVKFRNLTNKNTTVIYSGIPPLSHETKKSFKNKRVVFVTACRLIEIKGLSRLLTRFSEINKKRRNWELWILGEGTLKESLIKKASTLNIEDKVHFKGYQSDIKTFLLEADYYLNSSYNEALGISVIEAMSVGLPAVVSNVGGLPEVVKPGLNGFLLDFNDKIESAKILKTAIDLDEEEYKHMVHKSLCLYRSKFSIEVYGARLNETLLTMMNNK